MSLHSNRSLGSSQSFAPLMSARGLSGVSHSGSIMDSRGSGPPSGYFSTASGAGSTSTAAGGGIGRVKGPGLSLGPSLEFESSTTLETAVANLLRVIPSPPDSGTSTSLPSNGLTFFLSEVFGTSLRKQIQGHSEYLLRGKNDSGLAFASTNSLGDQLRSERSQMELNRKNDERGRGEGTPDPQESATPISHSNRILAAATDHSSAALLDTDSLDDHLWKDLNLHVDVKKNLLELQRELESKLLRGDRMEQISKWSAELLRSLRERGLEEVMVAVIRILLNLGSAGSGTSTISLNQTRLSKRTVKSKKKIGKSGKGSVGNSRRTSGGSEQIPSWSNNDRSIAFTNTLLGILPCQSSSLMIAVCDTWGESLQLEGLAASFSRSIAEAALNTCLEWMDHHVPMRRLAALQLLRQVCLHEPEAVIAQKDELLRFLRLAWRDGNPQARDFAAHTTYVLLFQLDDDTADDLLTFLIELATSVIFSEKRDMHERVQDLHAAVLALSTYISFDLKQQKATGNPLSTLPRFTDMCSALLSNRVFRSLTPFLRPPFLGLIPLLALHQPQAFCSSILDHMKILLNFSRQVAASSDKTICMTTLGCIASAVGLEVIWPVVPDCMNLCITLLNSKPRIETAATCLALFAEACPPVRQNDFLQKSIIFSHADELFGSVISNEVADALERLVHVFPRLLPLIQERLLEVIFLTLSGKERDTAAVLDQALQAVRPSGIGNQDGQFSRAYDFSQNSGRVVPYSTVSAIAAMNQGNGLGVADATTGYTHPALIAGSDAEHLVKARLSSFRVLLNFNMQGQSLSTFYVVAAMPYLSSTDDRLRRAAVLVATRCLLTDCDQCRIRSNTQSASSVVADGSYKTIGGKKLEKLTVDHYGPTHAKIVSYVVNQLLAVGVSDSRPDIRNEALSALLCRGNQIFDSFLCTSTSIQSLFSVLNDEDQTNRLIGVQLIERVLPRNPAVANPYMRKLLIKLISELKNTPRSQTCSRDTESTLLLLQFVLKAAKQFTLVFLSALLDLMARIIAHGNDSSRSANDQKTDDGLNLRSASASFLSDSCKASALSIVSLLCSQFGPPTDTDEAGTPTHSEEAAQEIDVDTEHFDDFARLWRRFVPLALSELTKEDALRRHCSTTAPALDVILRLYNIRPSEALQLPLEAPNFGKQLNAILQVAIATEGLAHSSVQKIGTETKLDDSPFFSAVSFGEIENEDLLVSHQESPSSRDSNPSSSEAHNVGVKVMQLLGLLHRLCVSYTATSTASGSSGVVMSGRSSSDMDQQGKTSFGTIVDSIIAANAAGTSSSATFTGPEPALLWASAQSEEGRRYVGMERCRHDIITVMLDLLKARILSPTALLTCLDVSISLLPQLGRKKGDQKISGYVQQLCVSSLYLCTFSARLREQVFVILPNILDFVNGGQLQMLFEGTLNVWRETEPTAMAKMSEFISLVAQRKEYIGTVKDHAGQLADRVVATLSFWASHEAQQEMCLKLLQVLEVLSVIKPDDSLVATTLPTLSSCLVLEGVPVLVRARAATVICKLVLHISTMELYLNNVLDACGISLAKSIEKRKQDDEGDGFIVVATGYHSGGVLGGLGGALGSSVCQSILDLLPSDHVDAWSALVHHTVVDRGELEVLGLLVVIAQQYPLLFQPFRISMRDTVNSFIVAAGDARQAAASNTVNVHTSPTTAQGYAAYSPRSTLVLELLEPSHALRNEIRSKLVSATNYTATQNDVEADTDALDLNEPQSPRSYLPAALGGTPVATPPRVSVNRPTTPRRGLNTPSSAAMIGATSMDDLLSDGGDDADTYAETTQPNSPSKKLFGADQGLFTADGLPPASQRGFGSFSSRPDRWAKLLKVWRQRVKKAEHWEPWFEHVGIELVRDNPMSVLRGTTSLLRSHRDILCQLFPMALAAVCHAMPLENLHVFLRHFETLVRSAENIPSSSILTALARGAAAVRDYGIPGAAEILPKTVVYNLAVAAFTVPLAVALREEDVEDQLNQITPSSSSTAIAQMLMATPNTMTTGGSSTPPPGSTTTASPAGELPIEGGLPSGTSLAEIADSIAAAQSSGGGGQFPAAVFGIGDRTSPNAKGGMTASGTLLSQLIKSLRARYHDALWMKNEQGALIASPYRDAPGEISNPHNLLSVGREYEALLAFERALREATSVSYSSGGGYPAGSIGPSSINEMSSFNASFAFGNTSFTAPPSVLTGGQVAPKADSIAVGLLRCLNRKYSFHSVLKLYNQLPSKLKQLHYIAEQASLSALVLRDWDTLEVACKFEEKVPQTMIHHAAVMISKNQHGSAKKIIDALWSVKSAESSVLGVEHPRLRHKFNLFLRQLSELDYGLSCVTTTARPSPKWRPLPMETDPVNQLRSIALRSLFSSWESQEENLRKVAEEVTLEGYGPEMAKLLLPKGIAASLPGTTTTTLPIVRSFPVPQSASDMHLVNQDTSSPTASPTESLPDGGGHQQDTLLALRTEVTLLFASTLDQIEDIHLTLQRYLVDTHHAVSSADNLSSSALAQLPSAQMRARLTLLQTEAAYQVKAFSKTLNPSERMSLVSQQLQALTGAKELEPRCTDVLSTYARTCISHLHCLEEAVGGATTNVNSSTDGSPLEVSSPSQPCTPAGNSVPELPTIVVAETTTTSEKPKDQSDQTTTRTSHDNNTQLLENLALQAMSSIRKYFDLLSSCCGGRRDHHQCGTRFGGQVSKQLISQQMTLMWLHCCKYVISEEGKARILSRKLSGSSRGSTPIGSPAGPAAPASFSRGHILTMPSTVSSSDTNNASPLRGVVDRRRSSVVMTSASEVDTTATRYNVWLPRSAWTAIAPLLFSESFDTGLGSTVSPGVVMESSLSQTGSPNTPAGVASYVNTVASQAAIAALVELVAGEQTALCHRIVVTIASRRRTPFLVKLFNEVNDRNIPDAQKALESLAAIRRFIFNFGASAVANTNKQVGDSSTLTLYQSPVHWLHSINLDGGSPNVGGGVLLIERIVDETISISPPASRTNSVVNSPVTPMTPNFVQATQNTPPHLRKQQSGSGLAPPALGSILAGASAQTTLGNSQPLISGLSQALDPAGATLRLLSLDGSTSVVLVEEPTKHQRRTTPMILGAFATEFLADSLTPLATGGTKLHLPQTFAVGPDLVAHQRVVGGATRTLSELCANQIDYDMLSRFEVAHDNSTEIRERRLLLEAVQLSQQDSTQGVRVSLKAAAPTVAKWLEVRGNYAKQCSMWSLLHYLLETRARSADNFRINLSQGVVVHTDTNVQSCLVLRGAGSFEEPVPFRLTKAVVSAFELSSPHGIFHASLTQALLRLKQQQRAIGDVVSYGFRFLSRSQPTVSYEGLLARVKARRVLRQRAVREPSNDCGVMLKELQSQADKKKIVLATTTTASGGGGGGTPLMMPPRDAHTMFDASQSPSIMAVNTERSRSISPASLPEPNDLNPAPTGTMTGVSALVASKAETDQSDDFFGALCGDLDNSEETKIRKAQSIARRWLALKKIRALLRLVPHAAKTSGPQGDSPTSTSSRDSGTNQATSSWSTQRAAGVKSPLPSSGARTPKNTAAIPQFSYVQAAPSGPGTIRRPVAGGPFRHQSKHLLTIQSFVNSLIDDATNPDNIVCMGSGWAPQW